VPISSFWQCYQICVIEIIGCLVKFKYVCRWYQRICSNRI